MKAVIAEMKRERRAAAKRVSALDKMLARVAKLAGKTKRTVRRKKAKPAASTRKAKAARTREAESETPAPVRTPKRKAHATSTDMLAEKRAKADALKAKKRSAAETNEDDNVG